MKITAVVAQLDLCNQLTI